MNIFLRSNLFNGLYLRRFALAIALLLMVGESWGQTTVTYTGMGSITCPASPTATIAPAVSGLTFSQITRGTGVTCASAGNGINGSGFNVTLANSIANSRWYSFSITSNSSTSFNVNSVSIQSQVSSATGTPNVSLQYSIGGSTPVNVIGSFTPTATSTAYLFTLATPISVLTSQTITFFVIPNSLTAAGTTCRVENNTSVNVTTATGTPTISLSSPNPSVPAGNIQQGSINNVLYQLNIGATTANASLSGLQVSTGGTYAAADVVNLKAWYSTDAIFSSGSDVLLATLTNPGIAGNKIFPAFSFNPIIVDGSTGYFFVTADISCSASIANNIFFNNTTQTQTTFTSAPTYNTDATFGGGLQTIIGTTPNNVTGLTPTISSTQVALAWIVPTGCYDEVIIVAHNASIIGTPTGTYTASSLSYTDGSNPAFPGGGVVVYNGTASPQTVTSLTNGTLYYFKVFTRKGTTWSSGVEVSAIPTLMNVATDYFRSNSNTTGAGGSWTTASNWQYSPDNGVTAWQTATLVPTDAAAAITIRSGHNIDLSTGTITADQITIDAGATFTVSGGTLTINNGSGTDLIVNGIYTVTGGSITYSVGYSVTFGSAATYNHNINGGTIPAAAWNVTSTCRIAGMTSTIPLNIPQAYGNFIWSNTGQTAFVNVNNASFSVAGTFTMNSSGTSNFTLVGATTTSYTYNIANITVNNGAFNLCFLDANNGGKATVNVSGNVTVAGSATAFLNFVAGTTGDPGSFSYRGEIVLSGNVTVGAGGSFYASHSNGNAYGRLTINGTASQILIAGGSTATRQKMDYLVNTGATALLQTTLNIYSAGRLQVDGTFDNVGENQIVNGGSGTSVVVNGRFITRDTQGFAGVVNSAIPTITTTLNAGSTVEYGRAGDQAVQSRTDYSNITFSNSGTKTLASACNPAGTVYITGTAIFEQSNNTFGNTGTSLTMDGGRYRLSGTGSKPDIGGTYALSAGVIEFYNSLGTAQTIRGTNDASEAITYYAIEVNGSNVGQGNANINLASGGSFTIKNAAVFTNNADAIVGLSGTQTLTIETGGKFVTGNALGFYGDVSGLNSPSVRNNIDNIVFQTNSTVEYSRTTAQDFTPITTTPVTNYKNVIISGGGTKTLTGAVTMEEVLTLTSGMVSTSNTNLFTLTSTASVAGANFASRISGGSDNSFVSGPMKKIGNTDFLFPVGKPLISSPAVSGHRYIGISGLGSATDEFTAEFFMASASALGPIVAPASPKLVNVSRCEYWRLDKGGSAASANVTLSWRDRSNCNVNYVTKLSTLVVAHNTSTSYTASGYTASSGNWDSYGNDGGTTGDVNAGSVTWNSVTAFSPFSLGSINQMDNPLPFQLNTFNAKPKQTAIQLDWSVGNNNQQQQYILERGSNPQVFETIATVNAKQGFTAADYVYDDAKPLNGWNYYRLRAIGTDGKSNSSSIIKVWWGKGVTVNVLPNPATEKIVINLSEPGSIKEIQIVNAMGQVMRKLTTVQLFNEVNISSMQAGIYYIRFLGENGLTTRSFVKQ